MDQKAPSKKRTGLLVVAVIVLAVVARAKYEIQRIGCNASARQSSSLLEKKQSNAHIRCGSRGGRARYILSQPQYMRQALLRHKQ